MKRTGWKREYHHSSPQRSLPSSPVILALERGGGGIQAFSVAAASCALRPSPAGETSQPGRAAAPQWLQPGRYAASLRNQRHQVRRDSCSPSGMRRGGQPGASHVTPAGLPQAFPGLLEGQERGAWVSSRPYRARSASDAERIPPPVDRRGRKTVPRPPPPRVQGASARGAGEAGDRARAQVGTARQLSSGERQGARRSSSRAPVRVWGTPSRALTCRLQELAPFPGSPAAARNPRAQSILAASDAAGVVTWTFPGGNSSLSLLPLLLQQQATSKESAPETWASSGARPL